LARVSIGLVVRRPLEITGREVRLHRQQQRPVATTTETLDPPGGYPTDQTLYDSRGGAHVPVARALSVGI